MMTAVNAINPVNAITPLQEIAKTRTFLKAWKKAITMIGIGYFKTEINLEDAIHPMDLLPDLTIIKSTIDFLNAEDQMFLSALVSFYNKQAANELKLRPINVSILDNGRKSVLNTLLDNYLPTHFW